MPDIIVDPFVGDGYSLTYLTEAINILPNQYGRLNELNVLPGSGIPMRTVVVERVDGVLNLLPSKPVGSPGTQGKTAKSKLINFSVPHIPHDDVVLPEEVAGVRDFGTLRPNSVASLLARKLQEMRNRHGITLEHLRWGALKGIIVDADGSTLVDLYAAFNIVAKSVDFVLGTAGTNVQGKAREVLRHVEKNLKGEVMSGVHTLVSPEFFDKLISHAEVKEAYKYFASAPGNALRDDVRRLFPFAGLVFEEHVGEATFLKDDGTSTTRRFIAADEGHAFPRGTTQTFKTWYAPADFNETVNTMGLEVYAKMEARRHGRGWDLHTQSNPLPMCRRPEVLVKVHTSN
jgi:hypothetical protein